MHTRFMTYVVTFAGAGLLMVWAGNSLRGPADEVPEEQTGDVEAGTVYFYRYGFDADRRLWAMEADRDIFAMTEGVAGEPSHQLHAGKRWFLTTRPIAGQTYRVGHERSELFAVREDGRAVQLTTNPDLEPSLATARWIPGSDDRRISWIARRWGSDGEIEKGGVYEAVVDFDENGDVIGLAAAPKLKLAGKLVVGSGDDPWCRARVPDIRSHDWSPDGGSVVYDSTKGDLVLVDSSSGERVTIINEPVSYPTWSPDGTSIAFTFDKPFGQIATIRPDGTGMRIVIDPHSASRLCAVSMLSWSPDGKHIMYQRATCESMPLQAPCDIDVLASTRDGRDKVNLTGDVPGFAYPVAWR